MSKNILVIGDSIIDRDVYCESIGLSLETPTLKTKKKDERCTFGGASNVVNNLLSLGCKVYFFTAIGEDPYGQNIANWKNQNLTLSLVKYQGSSVVKSRYWITQNGVTYKYLQINQGDKFTSEIGEVYQNAIMNIDTWRPEIVLLVDYRNGIFTNKNIVQKIIQYAKNSGAIVVSSSQTSSHGDNYDMFHGSDLICMNQDEAIAHMSCFEPTKNGIKKLSIKTGSSVCVTLGSRGSILYEDNKFYHCEAEKVNVVDTCGAGDAFLAALTIQNRTKNLKFCNQWAALATITEGVSVPKMEQLNEFI